MYTKLSALAEKFSAIPFDINSVLGRVTLENRREVLKMLPTPIAAFIEDHAKKTGKPLGELPLAWFSWIFRDKPSGPVNVNAMNIILGGQIKNPKGIPPTVLASAANELGLIKTHFDSSQGLESYLPENLPFRVEAKDIVGFAKKQVAPEIKTEVAVSGEMPPAAPEDFVPPPPEGAAVPVEAPPADTAAPADIGFLELLKPDDRKTFWQYVADNNRFKMTLEELKTVQEEQFMPELSRLWGEYIKTTEATKTFAAHFAQGGKQP